MVPDGRTSILSTKMNNFKIHPRIAMSKCKATGNAFRSIAQRCGAKQLYKLCVSTSYRLLSIYTFASRQFTNHTTHPRSVFVGLLMVPELIRAQARPAMILKAGSLQQSLGVLMRPNRPQACRRHKTAAVLAGRGCSLCDTRHDGGLNACMPFRSSKFGMRCMSQYVPQSPRQCARIN